ncbi:MAG: hypothetical protein QNJ20_01575 [Paracoccaceae bacterium]|nr:hypothetical protein [Paracoccaceae bacterium]
MREGILDEQDWDRIVFALSHFSHNRDFKKTLSRVLQALGKSSPSAD